MTCTDFKRALGMALVLVLLPFSINVRADTLGSIVTSIHNRGVYFDNDRFPDSVLEDFANDAQSLIATIGHTNQAESTYVLSSAYKYALPSDYYLVWVAILNPDPTKLSDESNPPYHLDYLPPERFGEIALASAGRPTSYTVWGDSLFLNVFSLSEVDTLTLYYFAEAVDMTAAGSTVDLPDAYVPLLKDAVEYMCVNRVVFPGRSSKEETLALTGYLRQAILGREKDEP